MLGYSSGIEIAVNGPTNCEDGQPDMSQMWTDWSYCDVIHYQFSKTVSSLVEIKYSYSLMLAGGSKERMLTRCPEIGGIRGDICTYISTRETITN
jgi:hypothetical protein